MQSTYSPSKLKRARRFGFRARLKTSSGRKILAARRRIGRKRLSASVWDAMSLARAYRLRYTRDFLFLRNKGKKIQTPYFDLRFFRENRSNLPPRLGIITSRKIGGAVQRNYARRCFRELFRAFLQKLPHGALFVIYVYPDFFSVQREQLVFCFNESIQKCLWTIF